MTFEDQVLLALTQALQDKTRHLRSPASVPPPTASPQPRHTRSPSPPSTSVSERGDLEYDDQQYRSLTNRQRAEIARGWFLLSRTEKFGLKPVTPYPVPLDATPKQREMWRRIDKAHARLVLAHIYARRISPTRQWTHPEVIDLYFRRFYPWQYEQPQAPTPTGDRADQYQKPFDEAKHPRVPAGRPEGGQFVDGPPAGVTNGSPVREAPAAAPKTSTPKSAAPKAAVATPLAPSLATNSERGVARLTNGERKEPPENARPPIPVNKLEVDPLLPVLDSLHGELQGVLEGFFVDGLLGTIKDIRAISLLVFQNALISVVPGLGPALEIKRAIEAGRRLSVDDVAQFRHSLGDGAEFVLKVAGELSNLANHPTLLATVFAGDLDDLEGQVSDELRLVLELSREASRQLRQAVGELDKLTPEERGRLFGRLEGLLLYEAAEAVATNIATPHVKSAKFGLFLKRMEESGVSKVPRAKRIIENLVNTVARVLHTKMCFVAGTRVLTPQGSVAIEHMCVGDMVLTRHERDVTLTGPILPQRIVSTIVTHPHKLRHVTIRGSQGETETLITTREHPFFVRERSEFVPAAELRLGYTLALADQGTAEVVGLKSQRAAPGETFTTYNIEVEEAHTYFVGTSAVWVHNAARTTCQLMEALYERYREQNKLDDVAARRKLKSLLDDRVKKGRMTKADGDKHWSDVNRILDERLAVDPNNLLPAKPKLVAVFGGLSAEEIDGLASRYADIRNRNNSFTWRQLGRALTEEQQSVIRNHARDKGLIRGYDRIRWYGPSNQYADFSEVAQIFSSQGGVTRTTVSLPDDLIRSGRAAHERWLNETFFGGVNNQPIGWTWHHMCEPGQMQLVPRGLHEVAQPHVGIAKWVD